MVDHGYWHEGDGAGARQHASGAAIPLGERCTPSPGLRGVEADPCIGENIGREGHDRASDSVIICVDGACRASRPALDENGMVSCCQFTYTGHNHAYAIFMVFYFFRYTDNHAIPRLLIGVSCRPDVVRHLHLLYSGIDRICDHNYKMTGDSYQKIAKGWN